MAKDKIKQQAAEETDEREVNSNLPAKSESSSNSVTGYEYDPEDLGGGFEGTTSEDFLIPFIGIFQKTHPQVEEENPAHIPGAKPGLIFNSVTFDMFDGKTGIRFIPVHREHSFIEWIPRDQGGGFVGKFDPTDPMVLEAKQNATEFGDYHTPSDNDLKETFTVYGLLVTDDEGGYIPCAISFTSTQIKNYKRWMTQAMAVQIPAPQGGKIAAPLWSHIYRLKTQFNENNKGSWYGWTIGFDGLTATSARIAKDHPLYIAAKQLQKQIRSGAVKLDMDKAQEAVAEQPTFGEAAEM